jgi:hypothetical protein
LPFRRKTTRARDLFGVVPAPVAISRLTDFARHNTPEKFNAIVGIRFQARGLRRTKIQPWTISLNSKRFHSWRRLTCHLGNDLA